MLTNGHKSSNLLPFKIFQILLHSHDCPQKISVLSALQKIKEIISPTFLSMGWKTMKTKLLRRPSTTSTTSTTTTSTTTTLKSLFSQPLDFSTNLKATDVDNEALESFIANLFTSIAAIKANYALLQLAQSPFDPDSLQIADASIVSEFHHLSSLKKSYLSNQIPPSKPPLFFQIQETNHHLKTFRIKIDNLESQLQSKHSTFSTLRSKLAEIDSKNRNLESKLHQNPHFSALNPNHFQIAVKSAVKSVRSFVKILVNLMKSSGFDLDAASSAIVGFRPRHRNFAFESYVWAKMLDFGDDRSIFDRRRWFDEYNFSKDSNFREIWDRNREFGEFCREKYLNLVHSKMELWFFGDLEGRKTVSSGFGLPDSGWFNGFGEMAKRVWMLRCLFFAFGLQVDGSVFRVRRGERFSEVFMETVVVDSGEDPIRVGFTVVPGFRVGLFVVKCQVYLANG